MKKVSSLAGIFCVGDNHAQAVENFRNAATGQNVMFYMSKSGVAFASTSGTDLYNPDGSGELLSENPELVQQIEFASESSSEDVRAQYTICLDGCGKHIVSDSAESLSHCPSCSSNLEEITDERVRDYLSTELSEQHSVSRTGLVVVGATAEEAQASFVAAMSGEGINSVSSATGSFNSFGDEVKFDPYTGAAVVSASAVADISSVSAVVADEQVEAHMYSCSAGCSHPVTVSSDEEPVFCAHCSAPLIDCSSSDEDEEGTDLDIDEDAEDEEDFDSESSSDEDDEEELEEDDFDDSDEEDLDEEEDDFDEDMEDEEDFDSESGSTPVKRLLSLSGDDEEDEDMEDLEDEEDLEEDDFDYDDEEDEDIDSESSSDEDEDDEDDLFIEEDELEDEANDEDIDADTLEAMSNNNVVSRIFDSISSAKVQHEALDPSLVSLSRTSHGLVNSVHMFYDGAPLAVATFHSVSNAIGEANARQNFETEHFVRAVSASLRTSGVIETCSNFGFDAHKIEMPVEKLMQVEADTRVEAATATVNQTITQSNEQYKERFVAALSSAMLGLTKNFWTGKTNPVVESLCSQLRSAGIKEPRALVERAFITNSPEFLKASVSQAAVLMNMSEVAQNEIAESISNAAGLVKAEEVAETNMEQEQPTTINPALQHLNVQQAPVSVTSQSSSQNSDFEARANALLRGY